MKHKPTDPYCSLGTDILRNVPGIMDKAELERFESLSVALAANALYQNPPQITDLLYLKSIHRTLFGQIYP